MRRGVTLMELLIVLVIIGIVSLMALPKLDYQRYRQDAASRVIQGSLRTAQRTAIQRQHDVVVSFDMAQNRLRILEDTNSNQTIDISERVIWKPLEEGAIFDTPPVGLTGAVTTPLVGTNVPVVAGMPSLIFHRNGAASGALEVYLGTVEGRAGHNRALAVTHSTGRVDWYRLVNYTTWKQGGM